MPRKHVHALSQKESWDGQSIEDMNIILDRYTPSIQPPTLNQEDNTTPFSIASHNIAKHDPIPFILHHFYNNVYILCLQEVTMPILTLQRNIQTHYPGVRVYGHTTRQEKGSVIIVREFLVSLVTEIPTPSNQFNISAIDIRLPHIPTIRIINVYGSRLQREQPAIQQNIQDIIADQSCFMLLGDFNCCITQQDYTLMQHPPQWQWVTEQVLTHKWVDLTRTQYPHTQIYTRYPNTRTLSSSRLDYIFLSPRIYHNLPQIFHHIDTSNKSSDHYPLSLTFHIPPLLPPSTLINPLLSLRTLTNSDIPKLHVLLEPLTLYTTSLDPRQLSISQKILHTNNILHTAAILTRHLLQQRPHILQPSTAEKQLREAHDQWQYASPLEQPSKYQQFLDLLENHHTTHQEKLKRRAWASLAQRKGAKRALQQLQSNYITPPLVIKTPEGLSSDPRIICKYASKQLQEQGGPGRHRVPQQLMQDMLQHTPSIPHPAELTPPSYEYFDEILKRGKKEKAPGPDQVNMYLLYHLPLPLKQWIHLTISANWLRPLPKAWNTAHIKLLYKKGDPSIIHNYRPISLLNSIYKIHAHILNDYLQSQINTTSILSVFQHGFRSNHRTHDHVTQLQQLLARTPDTYLMLLDMAKAFNSASHHTLFTIMQHYNFHSNALSLLQILYSNAYDAPTVNGFTLAEDAVIRGVRQGCPASPTLFALFLDPLIRFINHHIQLPVEGIDPPNVSDSLHVFADDIALQIKSLSRLTYIMQLIERVTTAYGLTLAPTKCQLLALGKALHVTIKTPLATYSTYEGDAPRTWVKYLGVMIYSHPSYDLVLAHALSTCHDFFSRLPTEVLNIKTAVYLINSILFPRIQYQLATIFLSPLLMKLLTSTIWSGLCKLVKLPINTPHKARYKTTLEGGIGLHHAPTRLAQQFLKHIGRYQLGQGPQPVNQVICQNLQLRPSSEQPFSLTQHVLWAAQILGLHTHRITGQLRLHNFIQRQEDIPAVPYGQLLTPGGSHVQVSAPLSLPIFSRDLVKHSCHEAALSIALHPQAKHIYTDGSAIPQQRGGYAIVAPHHHDPEMAIVQAGRTPYPCSYLSELLGMLYALQHAQTIPGHVIIFSDNLSLVQQINRFQAKSLTFHLSYAWYFTLLLPIYLDLKHRVTIVWIKAHVGFMGNEYADRYASWASYLPLPPSINSPPATLFFNTLPLIGKIPYKIYKNQIPQRAHTHIHMSTSYMSWAHCGPFKDLPYKWQNGLIMVAGYQPFWSLKLVKCDLCGEEHAGDAQSYLAHCSHYSPQRELLHKTFPRDWQQTVRDWYATATAHSRRLYIRGLTPSGLYDALTELPHLRNYSDAYVRSSIFELFKSRVTSLLRWYSTTLNQVRETVPSFTTTNKRGPDEWAPTSVPISPVQRRPYQPQPAPTGQIREPKRRRPP